MGVLKNQRAAELAIPVKAENLHDSYDYRDCTREIHMGLLPSFWSGLLNMDSNTGKLERFQGHNWKKES